MDPNTWLAVDSLFEREFVHEPDALKQARRFSEESGLPPIQVSVAQGKFLSMLTTICGAKRVLEVGTLGGYSAICIASALPPDGHLLTLEFSAHHAQVARKNVDAAGIGALVEIQIGAGLQLLPEITGTFELVFIDANKEDNPGYFTHALRLTKPGSLIIIDNVVWKGEVADSTKSDAMVLGIRQVLKMIGAEHRVTATAIQTVGSKGYDGFALIRVVS